MNEPRESVRQVAPWIAAVSLGTLSISMSSLVGSGAATSRGLLTEIAAFLVSGVILGALWPSRFAPLALVGAAAGPFIEGIVRGVVHGSVVKAGLLSTLGGGGFLVIPGLVVFALPVLAGAATGARLVGRRDMGVDIHSRTLAALLPSVAGAACALFLRVGWAPFAFLAPMAGTACSTALVERLQPRNRLFWTLLAVDVPVLVKLTVVLRDAEGGASHELWPIELAMTGVVAAIGAVLGVIGAQLLTQSTAASGTKRR